MVNPRKNVIALVGAIQETYQESQFKSRFKSQQVHFELRKFKREIQKKKDQINEQ